MNRLPIVVYRSGRPGLLLGRFALFADARSFVDLHNKDLPPDSDHRALAWDTDEWRKVWPREES